MAIAARVGSKIPKHTNLTHDEGPHVILGPFYVPTTNTTVYTCMAVTVAADRTLTACASKSKPIGVVEYRRDYKWGTTDIASGLYKLLPSSIEVYVIAFGPCLVALDVSEITDAALPPTSPVYAATGTAGLCSVEADLATGTAGEFTLGWNMDLNAGYTTLAAGADGDLCEVFVDPGMRVVSTS